MKYSRITWLFLIGTLAYGLGFLLLGDWSGVYSSSLYTSMKGTYHLLPLIWGASASIASIVAMVAEKRQSLRLRGVGSTLGMLTWFYAALVYLFTGYYLVFFSVALLYLGFWALFYFKQH